MPTESAAGRTTRAAVVAQAGAPFEVRELTLAPPRADEVIVRREACGMCHADISAQSGAIPFPLPGVLGHEGVGRVEEVGEAVTDVAPGQRVVISFTSCGRCPACLLRSQESIDEHKLSLLRRIARHRSPSGPSRRRGQRRGHAHCRRGAPGSGRRVA